MFGIRMRQAKWIWQSAAGSEADAIQAEQRVGRDMASVVLEETSRDSDQTTQYCSTRLGRSLGVRF